MDYRNKTILAPMVRIGTLPTRLLALDYGADLVYTEEIIDFKMLKCERRVNKVLGTVDFVQQDGTVNFRTCEQEKSRLVFQLGTANAQRALKVGKLIEKDIAALDINMGCPKEFSIKGGMGAALLDQPEKIKDILTTLVKNLSIPVTCKIRIKPTIEETLELVKMIETTGISALGVHGRTRDERSRSPNHNDVIKVISETLKIPVIANGGSREIKCFDDIAKFKENTGCSSVMLARAAQWNLSIFRSEGYMPMEDIIKAYLKYAIDYENTDLNAKYNVQQTMHEILDTPLGQKFQHSGTLREISDLFGMAEYYDKMIAEHTKKERDIENNSEQGANTVKKRKLEDGTELYEMAIKFNRNLYDIVRSPKLRLYEWTIKQAIEPPKYDNILHTSENKERSYYCSVLINGKKYASSILDPSKKWGEQAAAVVCMRMLGLDEGRIFKDGRTDPVGDPQLMDISNKKSPCKRPLEDMEAEAADKNKPVELNGSGS